MCWKKQWVYTLASQSSLVCITVEVVAGVCVLTLPLLTPIYFVLYQL